MQGKTTMNEALRKSGAIGSAATLAGGATGALLLALSVPAGASGLTYTVDSLADGAADPTRCSDSIADNCTLRDAIEAADGEGGANTVVFTAGLTGTITLTQGQLEVGSAVSIVGPGADLITVSGNNASTVFYFCADDGVQLSGVTITGGNAPQGAALYEESCSPLIIDSVVITGNTSTGNGGAIYTQDNLTVRNSIISDNTSGGNGGAMYVDGDLVMEGTVVSGNLASGGGGGGAYVKGDVAISTSTFDRNSAYYCGGGLYAEGSDGVITITDSTFSDNSAADCYGGAIDIDGTNNTVLIANTTITGNSAVAGGGVHFENYNLVTIAQSTIVGNDATSTDPLYSGGGIHFGNSITEITLSGTIVSGNSSAAGADDISAGFSAYPGGAMTANDSLLGDVDANVTVTGTGNVMSTDPGVAALANNGGATATMALLPTSAAVDAGPATVYAFPGNEFDQRGAGFPRIVGTRADIGAIEGAASPTTTTTVSDEPVVPSFTG